MSRNWTPREMYLIDLRMEQEGLGSLRKDLDNMVFVAPNGERISFFSDEKKKVMGMFKELGFLFGDNLYVLWETTEEHPRKRKRVLQATEEELLELISKLNADSKVNGILVQLPLPKHIDEDKIIKAIDPKKDVDGFHPQSVGALSIGQPGFVSCTPAGIIELLKRSDVEIEGKECVVVGRSNIVGKPMALLLLRENGTVTITHSRTANLKEVTKRADILVVAIGKPKFITKEYVKEGATVIDVGIHRIGTTDSGKSILCGDVDYEDVFPVASAITPVPGGVGPMTIAMLMSNCVHSVELQR